MSGANSVGAGGAPACARCARPTVVGTRCEACRAGDRERYARRKADGRCTKGCGRAAAPGRTLCVACKVKQKKTSGLLAAKRQSAGQCTRSCGRPARPGYSWCEVCAAAQRVPWRGFVDGAGI